MKKRWICLFLLAPVAVVSGQSVRHTAPDTLWKTKRLLMLNSFGAVLPVGPLAQAQQLGFAQSIGLTYFLSRSVFGRFGWDFNASTKRTGTVSRLANGLPTEVQYGGFGYNTLTLNVGYRIPTGNPAPYGFVGLGVSFVNAPQIRVDYTTQTTTTDARNGTGFTTQVGVGIKYSMQPHYLMHWLRGKPRLPAGDESVRATYVFYAEGIYQHVRGMANITDVAVQLVPIRLGINVFL